MRFFRALLLLYPRYFRHEYRAELLRSYEDRMRGRSALAAPLVALAEAVPGALLVRWDHLRQNTAAAMTQPTLAVDVRLALRQMRRTPLFSAVIIAVLALGIAINTGMLTILDAFVWQPSPGITRAASLVRLLPRAAPAADRSLRETTLSVADLLALRERRDLFDGVAGWSEGNLAADFGGGQLLVSGEYVTGNFFSLLGVPLQRGSGVFRDDDPATALSVVISDQVWRTFFGGADSALGAVVRVLNVPFTVVGIAAPEFSGVDIAERGDHLMWFPLAARAVLEPDVRGEAARRAEPWLQAVGQLAPGRTPGDVARGTGALGMQLARQRYTGEGGRLSLAAERLTGMSSLDGATAEAKFIILLVASLVLLITCTNVGALLLGRAVARRREVGIRLSLGATRLRLVRQLLTEALVFALCGAALGLALYAAFTRVVAATVSDVGYGLEPRLVSFGFAASLAVAATLVMGLAPALTATRAEIGEVIKGGGRQQVRRSRLQAAFVVAQLASSQPVLVVSALILASLSHILGGAAAPAPPTIVTMTAAVLRPGQGDSAPGRVGLVAVERRLAEEPGVRAASLSVGGPTEQGVRRTHVTPSYFPTREMPILRGRGMTNADVNQPVAVVNELAARRLWPGGDPLGRRLALEAGSFEVIGVTRAPDWDLEEPRPEMYLPLRYAPAEYYGARLTVRTGGDARAAVPRLREVIREAEPYAAVDNIRTVAEQAAVKIHGAWLTNILALLISATALLLASLGLYAIIAYLVAQRTREIGVRLAIGAAPGRVVREFFSHGMMVSAVGLAIGLPFTLVGVRVIEASLVGFTLKHVLAVTLLIPILLGVAALASWLPARRAGRVDPLIALQAE